ncbi:MAG TPA: hypothetical protein VGR28_07460 [Candidatus Thermoplasmatota archaeon]|jgi:hypothetical protein|nr:hypothetical protein [Candidatus Thermoplasmatota archaeon]
MEDGQSPAYLRGFVHGMHFLLLALHGRLTAKPLTREEVEVVLAEYYRMVDDYRETFEAPAATAVALRYEDDQPKAG